MDGTFKISKEQLRLFNRLIGSIFTGENVRAEGDVDWKFFYSFANMQHMVPLFYYALQKNGIILPDEVEPVFKKQSDVLSAQSILQQIAHEEINQAFIKKSVKFCHLKGAILKDVYSKASGDGQVYYLRPSSDIDVLIDEKDFDAATEALLQCGFKVVQHGIVHDTFMRGAVCVELHRYYYKKDSYLGSFNDDFWNIIYTENGCEYFMPKWYCYVTLLAHYFKHFSESGCGLRYLIDLWLYRKTNMSGEDYARAEEYLTKMKLDKFSRISLDAAEYIFAEGEYSKIYDDVCEYLATSGIYGTFSRGNINDSVRSGTGKSFIHRVFPNIKVMRISYPNVKAPLLPFYWIHRIFKILFTKRERLLVWYGVIKKTAEEKDAMNRFFEEVGIVEF